jgi:hypothetical protein
LILYTPAALELALLWPLVSFCGGDEERPETAESTLVKFSVSADILIQFKYGDVSEALQWQKVLGEVYLSNGSNARAVGSREGMRVLLKDAGLKLLADAIIVS